MVNCEWGFVAGQYVVGVGGTAMARTKAIWNYPPCHPPPFAPRPTWLGNIWGGSGGVGNVMVCMTSIPPSPTPTTWVGGRVVATGRWFLPRTHPGAEEDEGGHKGGDCPVATATPHCRRAMPKWWLILDVRTKSPPLGKPLAASLLLLRHHAQLVGGASLAVAVIELDEDGQSLLVMSLGRRPLPLLLRHPPNWW